MSSFIVFTVACVFNLFWNFPIGTIELSWVKLRVVGFMTWVLNLLEVGTIALALLEQMQNGRPRDFLTQPVISTRARTKTTIEVGITISRIKESRSWASMF